MPGKDHKKAAEHHDEAAKAHRTAADHHEHNDHKLGAVQSKKAHDASSGAHDASKQAHAKSDAKAMAK